MTNKDAFTKFLSKQYNVLVMVLQIDYIKKALYKYFKVIINVFLM